MKAEADRHFLQGINQLIGHGWPYTAEGVEYPGWNFYAAAVFNDKNPWWIVMPDVSRYLQRISFLMRQGQPANDIAIYLPNDDAWAHFTNGQGKLIDGFPGRVGPDLIPAVLSAGFKFEFFDDEAFKQAGRVEANSLVLGGNRYKTVILPNVERMPLDTMQKLEEFARSGGALIATRRTPSELPEFRTTETDQQRLRDLSRRTFEGPSARGHLVSDETVQLASTLNRLAHPDVLFSPATPEIGFIHRSVGDIQIYFLANTSNVSKNVKAAFRQQGMKAEWWDPLTGNVSQASIESQSPTETTLQLDVEPYGSRVLVFTKRTIPQPQSRVSAAAPNPLDLSNDWQISFGSNSGAERINNLRSWTDEERTRYFSGTATYEKTVS